MGISRFHHQVRTGPEDRRFESVLENTTQILKSHSLGRFFYNLCSQPKETNLFCTRNSPTPNALHQLFSLVPPLFMKSTPHPPQFQAIFSSSFFVSNTMSKRSVDPTTPSPKPTKSRNVTKSSQLEAQEASQTKTLVADFVSVFTVKKADKEVLHTPLKRLFESLFSMELKDKDGTLSKAVVTEYDLKVCKNKAETAGLSAFSLRVQKNTETQLRGVTMRKKATDAQRKTDAFKRLQIAAVVDLEEADIATLYAQKLHSSSASPTTTKHKKNTNANAKYSWPEMTRKGLRVIKDGANVRQYYCMILETGLTTISTTKTPSMHGHRVEITFHRELAAETSPAGDTTIGVNVPSSLLVDGSQDVKIHVQGGLTSVYVPLMKAVKQGLKVDSNYEVHLLGEAVDEDDEDEEEEAGRS